MTIIDPATGLPVPGQTFPPPAGTPGAPAPVPSAPVAPGGTDIQAIIDASVNAALAGVPAAVDAAVAAALAGVPGAVVDPTTGTVTEPTADVVTLTPLEELFVLLNIAPTPSQVANVTEWEARNYPPAASPPAGGNITVVTDPVTGLPTVVAAPAAAPVAPPAG